jgi:flagellin
MVINTNIAAQATALNLGKSSGRLAESLQLLSSGSKIITPADDSAGLAESNHLASERQRLNAVSNNLANAVSFIQTQDGYLQKISDALTRMSELSVMAQDVTKTDSDRALYNTEYHTLAGNLQNMAAQTFNGVSLFSANALQVTLDDEGNTFSLAGINLAGTSYNSVLTDTVDVIGNTGTGAVYAQNDLDRVIANLAKDRANLGASLEALNFYNDQTATLRDTLAAATSRITDVDVAQESTNYAKENILVQSGTAMLAQANSTPQSVLKLLS